jgi:hypothetical protein
MAKMVSNVLGVALALSIGIMLVSVGSASSVLDATYLTGNASLKSSNTTPAGNMTNKPYAGDMSKAGNATASDMSKAGNATASDMSKTASSAVTKLGQAVGGGLKGLGNLISPGKK